MLPNFFIVGAAKCGTTSMWEYLRLHPKIFMCTPKEPTYFSHIPEVTMSDNRKINWKEYLNLFESKNNEVIFGDASTNYLVDPNSAKKIHESFLQKITSHIKI